MGLTCESCGRGALKKKFNLKCGGEFVIALAGNPNVGKSTVFNELTGLRQHTGNWPGKTVVNARGNYEYKSMKFLFTPKKEKRLLRLPPFLQIPTYHRKLQRLPAS